MTGPARRRIALGAGLVWVGAAGAASAQVGYRASVDLRMQAVAFRGWSLDSVLASQTAPGIGGGLVSPAGYAADCPTGSPFCYYYRPGTRQTAAPLGSTVDLTVWGLGMPGLSVHANARALLNAGSVDWVATDPNFQLWEGYVEYARPEVTVRAGRQLFTSRLGVAGFDGGLATLRSPRLGLSATGYFGFGLASNAPVPITSDVVNPLGEFRPPERNLVLGAFGAWAGSAADVRVEWQREVDRASRKIAADRLAGSATLRPARRWTLTGGAEYNLAEGVWGSADASLKYGADWAGASVGYRRYRPFFDLWSIWAAFSPVAYNSALASGTLTPVRGLQLRGRVEYYRFEAADAPSALVTVENDGTRWSAGARFTRIRGWAFDLGYDVDKGVGARGDGWDASVGWSPTSQLSLRAYGATLDRPLELRFDDARVRWAGLDADLRLRPDLSIGVGGMYVYEDRRRPDTAAFDWNQTRITAHVTYVLGSTSADRLGLPRAIERMPSVSGSGR
jgi:hypothetical protein